MNAHSLAAILLKADPQADVRFWVDDDEEVDFSIVYDDETEGDDDGTGNLVGQGADVVNIDLDYVEELGAGEDDPGQFQDDDLPMESFE